MPNQHLPTKVCAGCGRAFAWRKKWERDWERVKFCSKKCARGGVSEAGEHPRAGRDSPRSGA